MAMQNLSLLLIQLLLYLLGSWAAIHGVLRCFTEKGAADCSYSKWELTQGGNRRHFKNGVKANSVMYLRSPSDTMVEADVILKGQAPSWLNFRIKRNETSALFIPDFRNHMTEDGIEWPLQYIPTPFPIYSKAI